MVALKDLYIGSNSFTEFPPVVFELTTLRELSLANSNFSVVPPHISKLAYVVLRVCRACVVCVQDY
jgi:Leucine-rich repeat (LRR) protein